MPAFRNLLIPALAALAATVALGDSPRDLGPILDRVRTQSEIPGAAAAILRDGKLIGVGVAGVRKLAAPERIERGDLLMIGSCGKALTRLLIGRLVDRGALKLNSTLAELLPDLAMRDEYKTVTLADILAHRGGIQPYTQIGPKRTPELFELTGTPTEQRAAFARQLLNQPPIAPPGTRFVYSNAGYGLLGHIAERVYKKSYDDALRELVFEPLGMKSAIVDMPESQPGRAGLHGHMRDRASNAYQPVDVTRKPLAPIAPAGVMSLTIDDFGRFAAEIAALDAGKGSDFLKPETATALREVRPGSKGAEGEILFGGDGWYSAGFALWPSKGIAIVAGTNAGDNDQAVQAIIDAVREACAPELAGGAGARNGPATEPAADAKRPRFGFSVRAEMDAAGDVWRISEVSPGSPAERAGLKVDDRVVEIDGEALNKIDADKRLERIHKSPLKLTVERDGKRIELTLEAGA